VDVADIVARKNIEGDPRLIKRHGMLFVLGHLVYRETAETAACIADARYVVQCASVFGKNYSTVQPFQFGVDLTQVDAKEEKV
jgi:hypothetical protein